jgi:hypothetical protein
LKTAGSNPLRVRIPRPPLDLRDSRICGSRIWEGFWEGLTASVHIALHTAARRDPAGLEVPVDEIERCSTARFSGATAESL